MKTCKVTFSDVVIYHETYSNIEYDRQIIESVKYRYMNGLMNTNELESIYKNLRYYKLYEMPVCIEGLYELRLDY